MGNAFARAISARLGLPLQPGQQQIPGLPDVAGTQSQNGIAILCHIQQCLDAAIDRGAVSYPVIKHTEAMQLPYLQACIWEGLRIYPPLVGLQSKMAPPQGETVNGTFFPRGTEIATCPSMVTRRKDIYGDDVDIFRPERWIEADASTRAKYERMTDVIFGSGRFVCLGRNIAWMELNKAFVEVCATGSAPRSG